MQQENSGDVYMGMGGGDGGSALTFPDVSQILPWALPPVHAFNPVHFSTRDHDPFLLSAAAAQPPYGGMFNRRPSAGYESEQQLRLLSQSLGQVVHHHGSGAPFGLHAELQKLSAQEIMDAKALAASKSHSEAERRRRERINNHLAKLRSLLPNTTKTDKASLLAEVIQHVKELKRQTCVIAETNPVPTEMDELTVDNANDEEGKWVIKASICCEDRPDLLPELIKTLKALKLRTLRAEITTLGGRVRNVLFITGDDEEEEEEEEAANHDCITSIHEALKAVMERTNADDAAGSVKRQRTNLNILDHYRSF
ncbi:transcription factor bHLH30 [Salvia miltiorrhiza]|uniref:Basic helix-loop-helix transcription factor n=1 Tax=Salvia miltiorrhiza TaxID=226208 RepID=A0A0H3Y8W2_SALMI|nr:transcription factor bHLH30 [Salvia miltiorrhiza]XP_057810116.1 transcription factor bHLH30 [Salvia miltiorrhiza]AKN09600.1 basic helix-loop-helix transcription factor [Salvia miltiorrhiza]